MLKGYRQPPTVRRVRYDLGVVVAIGAALGACQGLSGAGNLWIDPGGGGAGGSGGTSDTYDGGDSSMAEADVGIDTHDGGPGRDVSMTDVTSVEDGDGQPQDRGPDQAIRDTSVETADGETGPADAEAGLLDGEAGQLDADAGGADADASLEADAVHPDADAADVGDAGPRRLLTVLPMSTDDVTTHLFAVLTDGQVYADYRPGLLEPFAGFVRVTDAAATPAPVYAPLAGVSRVPDNIDVFFVDNAGQIRDVSWDAGTGLYTDAVVRSEAGLGGVGTAPPGTQVSAVAFSSDRIDVWVIDSTGTLLQFQWTSGTSWRPAVRQSPMGLFPPGAPASAVSRVPAQTEEVFAVDVDGFAWHTNCAQQCPDDGWVAARFDEFAKFIPGTKLSLLSRDVAFEEVYGVDAQGTVWRAWWSATTAWWTHTDYNQFGQFSSAGMVSPGATIATHARNVDMANLIAVDHAGSILSEWWDSGQWNFPSTPWESTVTTLWSDWNLSVAAPDSVPAMLGNVGIPGELEMFWIRTVSSGGTQLWAARATPTPPGSDSFVWSTPAQIALPTP
jgi:hypothetical protein